MQSCYFFLYFTVILHTLLVLLLPAAAHNGKVGYSPFSPSGAPLTVFLRFPSVRVGLTNLSLLRPPFSAAGAHEETSKEVQITAEERMWNLTRSVVDM